MARHPRWVRRVFSDDDLEAMRAAIARTEAQTSAEIRLHLEPRVPRANNGDALIRARQVFAHLGMHRTARRNGVLIYLA
ncbi:MAG TPA: TPM domain-containing protein, partial [Methylomirabilota bacterium]|nr:TPM domain-containing protein [Methylomirabilota bacterium]